MTAPSLIRAARAATDKWARIGLMRDVMLERAAGPTGACTVEDLCAAGFTRAEIAAYPDPARGLISERKHVFGTAPDGRLRGVILAQRAREIRARRRPPWSAPVIHEHPSRPV